MNSKNTPILLVEDDPLDVENIRRAFKAQGMENKVYVASTGTMALDMLLGTSEEVLSPAPKIILLDLNLPGMGGLEVLQAIRANHALRSCSVFVMTSSHDEKDVLNAYDLNVAGYIVKPIQYGSYTETVATLNSFWELIELPN
ncbi:chemotaxis protein CheY [Rufibacter sp. DG15C]|uniref:response regulator n=1 Tax=Rufibacter sp. DG15C TaxID=1379909 RepID=UPI00078D68E8|nr:response regulator [Rufibacter sp. DG15C]AMM52022.1 chemotaxis protein CheY [Rufibacter sp. DG15C]